MLGSQPHLKWDTAVKRIGSRQTASHTTLSLQLSSWPTPYPLSLWTEHLSWSFSVNSKADLRYSGHKPWNHLLLLLSHFTSELSVNVPGSEYKVLPLQLPTMLLTQVITICILEYWNTYNSSLCLWFCSAFRLYPIKYKSYYITLINPPMASLPGTNGPK